MSLPGQVAAVRALEDPNYYLPRYAETHLLRRELGEELRKTAPGIEIIPGIANFLLCHLPEDGPTAPAIVSRCCELGLFLRDAGAMSQTLGRHALRIAVKDQATNHRMIEIFARVVATS